MTVHPWLDKVLAVVVYAALSAVAVAAQEESPPVTWSTRAELGASVFFGNTSQVALTTTATAERESEALGITSRMMYTYGESTDIEGNSTVNKRSWRAGLDLNFDPQKPLNAFVGGKLESVFEKKIDLRWSVGGGGRIQFWQGPAGGAEFSMAVLAEKTIPRAEANQESTTAAKWSNRVRFTREMSEGRINFEFDASYEPEFSDMRNFTLGLRTALAFQLTEGLALQISVMDAYDSQAESRGARTNNDGQLFFSVVSTF